VTSKNVDKLNRILGERLGVNKLFEPLFAWVWSEDLLWPATATGRKIAKKSLAVPIIGGETEIVPAEEAAELGIVELEDEYVARKQCDKYNNQWLIAAWFPPETLQMWQNNFPGAPYPSRGFRIFTNAALAPWCEPTMEDTEDFIAKMKEQRSMPLKQRLDHMEADAARKELSKRHVIEDEVRDLVPAFANYQPGKRGAYVSLPNTKIDKLKDGSLVN
jgi:hypothetical protein